jgi:hypothetical protein
MKFGSDSLARKSPAGCSSRIVRVVPRAVIPFTSLAVPSWNALAPTMSAR